MKKLATLSLAVALALGGGVSSHAAGEKVGATCSKVNAVSSASGKAIKCTKKGSKKVWAEYKPKASSSDAVPMGAWFKTGDWRVRILAVNDNMSEFICAENMFNDGCDLNDDFEGVPDPAVDSRWVEVYMEVQNATKSDESPYFGDIGFLNKGRVNWQGMFQPAVENGASDITLVPNGKSEVGFYVFLKNGLGTSVVAIKPNLFESKTFYFKAN